MYRYGLLYVQMTTFCTEVWKIQTRSNLVVKIFLTVVLCVDLIGCGSGGDSESSASLPSVQMNFAQTSTSFPQIQVISPTENSVVFSDSKVRFAATVTQEGSNLNATVLWESSIDGPLDTSSGEADLSSGVHLLTVTVSSAASTVTSLFFISAVRRSDVVESLIFGSGVLSTLLTGCLRRSEWVGWPRGTALTINIPDSMSSSKKSLISQFSDQVSSITNNNLKLAELGSKRQQVSSLRLMKSK